MKTHLRVAQMDDGGQAFNQETTFAKLVQPVLLLQLHLPGHKEYANSLLGFEIDGLKSNG